MHIALQGCVINTFWTFIFWVNYGTNVQRFDVLHIFSVYSFAKSHKHHTEVLETACHHRKLGGNGKANLSSFLSQSHWSSTDINIIIPLSSMGGQDTHIWKRGEREAWWALQSHDRKLDMAERVNYIGKTENSWASRLLEWGDCLSEVGLLALSHTHTPIWLSSFFLFPLFFMLLSMYFFFLFFPNSSVIHGNVYILYSFLMSDLPSLYVGVDFNPSVELKKPFVEMKCLQETEEA